MDAFIANDENMLPGLAKMLESPDRTTQDLAAKCLDYVSVSPEHHTLVCTTENLLRGVTQLLRNTRSRETRMHAIQALVYLSSHTNNRFLIARTPDLLLEFKECLELRDPDITLQTTQILYNLCLLKENIPLVAKNNELRMVLKARHAEAQDMLQTSEEYEGIEKDLSILKLSGVTLDLLYTYDTRLNSKIILRGEGFHSPSIAIGKHVSQSMIGSLSSSIQGSSNSNNNSSLNESVDATFQLSNSFNTTGVSSSTPKTPNNNK